MIRCSIAIVTVALGLIGSSVMMPTTIQAVAVAAAPDSAGGRYMFETRPDGFIRLDTQTGEVAWCSQRTVGLACEAAPEDRAVLEGEIARLTAENAALKKAILAHGLPLPPGATPESGAEPPTAYNGVTLQLPSDADIDRMVAYTGRLWHRFMDAVERAEMRVLNKS